MNSIQTDDGVRISYETRGEGALTLLMMHGWGGSGASFDQTIEHLDLTSLRVVTPDFRGHGDSDKPDTGYTDERLAYDVLSVMDHEDVEKFMVVGFSMSGRYAQYLSVLEPERILGQVLVAGCPAFPIPIPEEARRDWVDRAGDAQRLQEVPAMFITRSVEQTVLAEFGVHAAKATKIALDETLGTLMTASFADRVPSIKTPTLVIGGIHDPLFTPDGLRQGVVEPLSRARLALLDCNHEILMEQPRELAALIEAFIAGLGVNIFQRKMAPV